jgi:hypothetical protein
MTTHMLDAVFLDNLHTIGGSEGSAPQTPLPWADEHRARRALGELGFLADSHKVPAWYLLIDWNGRTPVPPKELAQLLQDFSALDARGRDLMLGVLERRIRYMRTVANNSDHRA